MFLHKKISWSKQTHPKETQCRSGLETFPCVQLINQASYKQMNKSQESGIHNTKNTCQNMHCSNDDKKSDEGSSFSLFFVCMMCYVHLQRMCIWILSPIKLQLVTIFFH